MCMSPLSSLCCLQPAAIVCLVLPATWSNAGASLLTPARRFAAVYIVDSSELPAYKAEVYHQFHNGIGKAYPTSYTQGLRESFLKDGRLRPSGCPELKF